MADAAKPKNRRGAFLFGGVLVAIGIGGAVFFVLKPKPPTWRARGFIVREMGTADGDVKLPSGLWDRLLAVDPKAGGTSSAGGHGESDGHGGSGSSAPVSPQTDFMPMRVFLVEKTRGVLGGRDLELRFGPGGGEIDFKDLLSERNGTFHIVFETALDQADTPPPKVFYLSNALKRKVEGEEMGAGCDTYHDVTTFLARSSKDVGITVNSTSGRHVSTLAGTYFFAIPHAGKLFLAQITVKDSRFRELHCR